MDWPVVGLVVALIIPIAGDAWRRFGRVEKAISRLESDVQALRADVKRILERLPAP